MNTDPSQAPSGSALPKSKRLLRADTDRASQQAAGYTGDARRMIQSRYHDRWKLALILAVLFG